MTCFRRVGIGACALMSVWTTVWVILCFVVMFTGPRYVSMGKELVRARGTPNEAWAEANYRSAETDFRLTFDIWQYGLVVAVGVYPLLCWCAVQSRARRS